MFRVVYWVRPLLLASYSVLHTFQDVIFRALPYPLGGPILFFVTPMLSHHVIPSLFMAIHRWFCPWPMTFFSWWSRFQSWSGMADMGSSWPSMYPVRSRPGVKMLFRHKWEILHTASLSLHCFGINCFAVCWNEFLFILVLNFGLKFSPIVVLRKRLQLDTRTNLTPKWVKFWTSLSKTPSFCRLHIYRTEVVKKWSNVCPFWQQIIFPTVSFRGILVLFSNTLIITTDEF